jgi:hypothetical protein
MSLGIHARILAGPPLRPAGVAPTGAAKPYFVIDYQSVTKSTKRFI